MGKRREIKTCVVGREVWIDGWMEAVEWKMTVLLPFLALSGVKIDGLVTSI